MSEIILAESATPSTPSTGKAKLFIPTSTIPTIGVIDDAGVVGKIAFSSALTLTYTEGTWTPAVTGTGSAPTVTYTTQTGRYTRIGNVVFYHADIIINTISGGTGNLRITGLPIAASSSASSYVSGHVYTSNVDLPGTPVSMYFQIVGGQAYGEPYIVQDNGATTAVALSGVAASDVIAVSGFYFV